MVKIVNKKIALSEEELNLLGENKEYELIPNKKGIFLLIEKELLSTNKEKKVCINLPQVDEKQLVEEEKQKLIGLIRKEKLSNLVEGKFEEKLNETQKNILKKLVEEKKIIVFKLNESYKKGVYRVTEQEKKLVEPINQRFDSKEKPIEEYNLTEDGFLIAKNTNAARSLSFEYEGELKEGTLKGIRTFEGTYYLIENELLKQGILKVINSFGEKNSLLLEELAKKINYSKLLTKIICEFLKEEGELIEKKKEQYSQIN